MHNINSNDNEAWKSLSFTSDVIHLALNFMERKSENVLRMKFWEVKEKERKDLLQNVWHENREWEKKNYMWDEKSFKFQDNFSNNLSSKFLIFFAKNLGFINKSI